MCDSVSREFGAVQCTGGLFLTRIRMASFPCEICLLNFGSASILDLHHSLVHKNPNDNLDLIPISHESGMKAYNLENKEKLCESSTDSRKIILDKRTEKFDNCDVKVHKCQYCDKTFTRTFNKPVHERIHTGEKPFQCQFCGKRFVSKRYQREHEQRIHATVATTESTQSLTKDVSEIVENDSLEMANDYPLQAENEHVQISKCQKGTSRFEISANKALVKKSYKCQFCNKTFTRSYNKSTHEQIHTGEKPYQCQFCAKRFICKRYQREHEQRIHATVTTTESTQSLTKK